MCDSAFLNGSQTHVGSVLVANLELVQLLIDLQSLVSLFYIYVTFCLVSGFMKLQGFFSHCIHLELGLVVTPWQNILMVRKNLYFIRYSKL